MGNVNTTIRKAVTGMDGRDQAKIDGKMIDLDGTINKSNPGANAILGVSLAVARVTATTLKQPLYKHLRASFPYTYSGWKLPTPMMNVINGGVHADSGLNIQEFMLVPHAVSFSEQVRIGSEVFHILKSLLKKDGFSVGVGDEGGFAPRLDKNSKALEYMTLAVKKAGFRLGKDVSFALDPASSEFHSKGLYSFDEKKLTGYQLTQIYKRWSKKYPLISVEDGLAEDDWGGWEVHTRELGGSMIKYNRLMAIEEEVR